MEWSATLGDRYPEKTFYVTGVDHVNLIKNAEILAFINDIINGNCSVENDSIISAESPMNKED